MFSFFLNQILNDYVLSGIIFFPLVWSLFGLVLPVGKSGKAFVLRTWFLIGSLAIFYFFVHLFYHTDFSDIGLDWAEVLPWIPAFNIRYAIGIDGVSGSLMLLTTFLMPLVILSTFEMPIKRVKLFYVLLFSLETFMLGAFASADLFLFYLFWEAMLIPMYFIIGIWGGKERIYAATKFFIYTLLGSLLMLVAIFYLTDQHRIQFGNYSSLLSDLCFLKIPGEGWLSPQNLLFLAFAFAFAIKVPLFPFHTWLPDAHVQAPTSGSVILAAILLKMGGYGFIRFAFPLFPDAIHSFQLLFMGLGAVAIVYGACLAWVQTDMKKLVAYSSVSHMGYVILGLFSLQPVAMAGAVYQMLNHGISTGGLFLMVGMIYERRHTREIAAFSGLAHRMPLFAVFFLILTLSSIGLPGTNGFIGEFLILLGSWKTDPTWTAVAACGVVLGAVYMLSLFQRLFLGENHLSENQLLSDLSFREIMLLLPLIGMIFWMGLQPNFFFNRMESALESVTVHQSKKGGGTLSPDILMKEMNP